MRELLHFATRRAQELVDITDEVTAACGAAAVMIQENWDESVQEDVIDFLARQVPKGVWKHDAQDGNGDARLKAGLVGPSETIPLIEGRLGLSRWQNIFFCEFDGPRQRCSVVVTVLADPSAHRWGERDGSPHPVPPPESSRRPQDGAEAREIPLHA